MYDFSKKLIELRKQNGISQEELSFKLNVSRQTISRWESGIRQPNAEMLNNICNFYKISADYLLNDGIKEAEITVTETHSALAASTPENKPKNTGRVKKTILLGSIIILSLLMLLFTILGIVILGYTFSPDEGAVESILIIDNLWLPILMLCLAFLFLIIIIISVLFYKKRYCNRSGT